MDFQVEIGEVESGGSASACWRMREREKREICFVIEVQPIRGRQVASSPSAEVFTVAATSDLIATVRSTIRACAQFGYLCLLIGHLYRSIYYHVSYLLANKCYVF